LRRTLHRLKHLSSLSNLQNHTANFFFRQLFLMALLTINGKTDFLIADVIIIRSKDSITALVAGC